MRKQIILFALSFLFMIKIHSQTELGADYRYSGGKGFSQHSIGASMENFSGKNSWTLGVNYNFSNFSSARKSDNGSGVGIFAGYRYGFAYGNSGNLFGGVDFTLTFNKDKQGNSFTVLSPAIEMGYHHTFNNFGKGAFGSPSIGVGYNFEAGQKDEEFDESAFIRARMTVGYRF